MAVSLGPSYVVVVLSVDKEFCTSGVDKRS